MRHATRARFERWAPVAARVDRHRRTMQRLNLAWHVLVRCRYVIVPTRPETFSEYVARILAA